MTAKVGEGQGVEGLSNKEKGLMDMGTVWDCWGLIRGLNGNAKK